MSIKSKILYSVIGTIFVLGVLASFFVYFLTKEFYTQISSEGMSIIAQSQAEEFYTLVDHAESLIENVSEDTESIEHFTLNKLDQDAGTLDMLEDYNIGGAFSAIYLLDSDGVTTVSTDESFVGNDYSFRKYYENAFEQEYGFDVAVGVTSGKLGYYFSRVIEYEGEVLGVAVAKMRPEVVAETMESAYSHEGAIEAHFMLVDYHGVVIFAEDEDKQFKSLGEMSEELLHDIEDDQHYSHDIQSLDYQEVQDDLGDIETLSVYRVYDEYDGAREMLIVVPLGNGLFLVTEADEGIIEASSRTIAATLAVFVFLAAFIAAVLIVLMVRRLLSPLQKLKLTVQEIDAGNLDSRADIASGDELQELGDAFNKMASSLIESRTNIEAKVEERTEELEKFQLAVDNASDHIVITDVEGAILFANKAVERITGYSNEETVGKKAGSKDLWGGLMDKEFYQLLWKTIKEEKQIFKGRILNKRKNGDRYTAEVSVAPLLDEGGNVKFFVGIERDVSVEEEAKQILEEAYEQSKSRSETLGKEKREIEALLSNIGDGIIATDQDGVITTINGAALRMLGLEQEDAVGHAVVEILKMVDENDKETPVFDRPMVKALSSGEKTALAPSDTRYYLRKDGAKFPVGLTVAPLIVGTKIVGTVEVFRDITIEKDIDKAKTEFVSLASHQLRTPLSTINWYTEMVLNGDAGELNDEQKEYIGVVAESNKRMAALVDSLLNVSRLELGTFVVEPEPVNLEELAQTVITELEPQMKQKGIEFSHTCSAEMHEVNADPKLMGIIFQNLLSNAVKYTPEGGKVSCEIIKKGDFFELKVSDTGYGIPKAQQSKMFEKLFRADNVKEHDTDGTGLGLYIVKSIVDHSGGTIWFESEEDKGTTFHVKMPVSGMARKDGTKKIG